MHLDNHSIAYDILSFLTKVEYSYSGEQWKKMVLSNLQCVDLRFKTLYFLKPYLLRVGRESYVSY